MTLFNNKKSSGLHQISLWCIIVIIECSLCFSGTDAYCSIITSTTDYPTTVKVLNGQPLELFCKEENYTADDLEFFQSNITLPSETINGTLRFYNDTLPKGLYVFYCRNKLTHKRCLTRVVVDSVPQNVIDFACRSDNLDKLNCTWSKENDSVTLHSYSLSSVFDNINIQICAAYRIAGSKIFYCSWSPDMHPRYRQMAKKFSFILNACNLFGCNEQNFTVDHFSIVKPSPVNNLSVLSNSPHSVLLYWRLPPNMIDFLPNGVEHKIEYQISKIDSTLYFRKVDLSKLPAQNSTYRFLLSDLPYADMRYVVRIYIKTVEATSEEFWSQPTEVVFSTASDRPSRPPETVTGAFDQYQLEGKRRVNVYWKSLEDYEEIGTNFTYIVVAYEALKNPVTLTADIRKQRHVVLEPASPGPINVYIWSVNEDGSSENSSHLYIPPVTDTEGLRVPSFTKVEYDNGAYELTWVGVENVDNYTLIWCRNNATNICTGRLDYRVLNAEKTHEIIHLPLENRYQFAIAANKDDKTSGMLWAAFS